MKMLFIKRQGGSESLLKIDINSNIVFICAIIDFKIFIFSGETMLLKIIKS